MPLEDRSRVVAAAQSILDQDGWCVLEICTDVPRQRWDARVLICKPVADAVADIVAEEVRYEPSCDARLTGCDRRMLRPDAGMGTHLCYIAELQADEAPVTGLASRARAGG